MPSHSQPPPDKRLVIGITGRIGAGKTSAGMYLQSRFGFQYLRYSLVLSDWLAKDPESKSHLQDIGWEVMAKGMQAELNRRLIEQIKPSADVAVDGLRHPLDFESLKECFGASFRLLFVDSPLKERWKRKMTQSRYATLESFEAADSHPVEQQIESLRAKAGFILPNEGSLQDFYAALDKAIVMFRAGDRI